MQTDLLFHAVSAYHHVCPCNKHTPFDGWIALIKESYSMECPQNAAVVAEIARYNGEVIRVNDSTGVSYLKKRYLPHYFGANWQVYDSVDCCFFQGVGMDESECRTRCNQLNAEAYRQWIHEKTRLE